MSNRVSEWKKRSQIRERGYFTGRRAKVYFRLVKAIHRVGIAPETLTSLAYRLIRPRGSEMSSVGLMTASEDVPDRNAVAAWRSSTRDIPADLLSENYERISALTGMDSTWRVLDVGCGNGKLAMPLLDSGFEVVAIDVSSDMLGLANTTPKAGWRGTFVYGDARDLEFADGCFDAAIVSRQSLHIGNLLQVIAETVRVVRPEGLIMVIEGAGTFDDTARRLFRTECGRRGLALPMMGPELRSHDEQNRNTLAAYFAHLGATRLHYDVSDLKWTKTITYRECLEHLRIRVHSEFWLIPDDDYDDILEYVQKNLERQSDGLDTTNTLASTLQVDLYATPVTT